MVDTIKANYKKITLGVALLIFLLYIFTPRSLTYMAKVHKISIGDIDCIQILTPSDKDQMNEFRFYKDSEIKEIIDLMDRTYVRKKVFKKDAVSYHHKGYIISIVSEDEYSKFLPFVSLFTDEIISFDSKQYVLYNKNFSKELDLLLGVEP